MYANYEEYKKNNDKKFFFIHNLAPHAPYEFNPIVQKENFLNNVSTSLNDKTYSLEVQKSLYLDNIKCTNQILSKIINKIINEDPNAMILLSSDHGARLGKNYLLEKIIQLIIEILIKKPLYLYLTHLVQLIS